METGKTSKYLKYAIGEIILVVIGILIALSINNWNENRKDRIKETAILKELNKDFTNNLLQFENVKKVHSNSLKSAEKFKMYINYSDLLSVKDSIAKYYYLAFNSVTYNPSNGQFTFDQVTGLQLTKDLPIAEIARMTGVPPREILRLNPKIKPSE